ncbi:MAG: tetratricopeptide repeat protein [Edaphobacter sp.]
MSATRRLILRDTLTFLSLTLITVVLFAITLFLFRSFASRREELAESWSARGRAAMIVGDPQEAVVALRTALRYAPGERSYELLLAQALGDAGHTEESYNYFLGLWETQPGDGFINLRLARLAAERKETQTAINYYRASIYGTWEGDGAVRRRDVRLELSRYLIECHEPSSARTELLIAGGNAPDDTNLALTLGPLLEQADAPRDALNNYEKVLAHEPDNITALEDAGRLQYGFGRFEEAHRILEQAAREHVLSPELTAMIEDSAKILALAPSKKLPPAERVSRILRGRDLAKKRFESCNTQIAAASGMASQLQSLGERWMSKEANADRVALLYDTNEQEAIIKLTYDTEIEASQICGTPTGDDATLLLLATSKAVEP